MTYDIEELSLEHVDLIALAMDYFLCNADLKPELRDDVEVLFYFLDDIANDAHEEADEPRLVSKLDNLLVVDFTPKSG